MPQRLEKLAEVLVVLAQPSPNVEFQLVKPLLQLLNRTGSASQLDERAHDLDVDGDGPIAAEHPGEHCHSLLGENVWRVATAATAIV